MPVRHTLKLEFTRADLWQLYGLVGIHSIPRTSFLFRIAGVQQGYIHRYHMRGNSQMNL